MEKETTSELVYDNLLGMDFYKDLIIDPSIDLPKDFPDINKYVKQLGEGPLALYDNIHTFDVLYPGGIVTYLLQEETGELLIDSLILFGVTTEPGVRALGTKRFDTHLNFDIEKSNRKNPTEERRDDCFSLGYGERLKITIEKPEDTNIKDWWTK